MLFVRHRDLVNYTNLEIRNAVRTAGSISVMVRIIHCGGNRQTFATCRGFCRPYDKDRDLYNQMDPHYRQTSATNIHRKCRKACQQFLHNGSCAFVLYKPTGPPADTTIALHGIKHCRRLERRLVLRGTTHVKRSRPCGMQFRIQENGKLEVYCHLFL